MKVFWGKSQKNFIEWLINEIDHTKDGVKNFYYCGLSQTVGSETDSK